jgi:hypothetical protein
VHLFGSKSLDREDDDEEEGEKKVDDEDEEDVVKEDIEDNTTPQNAVNKKPVKGCVFQSSSK